MSNKTYYVEVPIAGKIGVFVEAPNEEEAKDLAFDATSYFYLSPDKGESFPEGMEAGEVEWDPHERLVTGNCIHFWHNEITVQEEK